MEELLVKPYSSSEKQNNNSNSENQKVTLNGVASRLAQLHFPFAIRVEGILDAKVVEEALSRTLADYDNFASGRLMKSPDGEIFIGKIGTGALLQIQYMNEDKSAAPDGESLDGYWRSSAVMPELDMENARIKKTLHTEAPLVVVSLSIYEAEEVSILGFSFSHSLGDRASLFMFVSTLSFHCDVIAGFNTNNHHPFKKRHTKAPRLKDYGENKLGFETLTKERLYQMWNRERFGRNPLDHPDFNRTPPPTMLTHSLEVRANDKIINDIKTRIIKMLPQGEWLSSMECFTACVALAYCNATNLGNSKPVDLEMILDLRKCLSFEETGEYFGNFITQPRAPLQMHALNSTMLVDEILQNILKIAISIHDLCQSCIGAPKCLAAEDYCWQNLAVENGFDIYDWFLLDVFQDEIITINSVAKSDWFRLNGNHQGGFSVRWGGPHGTSKSAEGSKAQQIYMDSETRFQKCRSRSSI
eukprot:CAMPEP_0204862548 /NCGR_PEP_ID=MMETSP1348-20121228/2612_1 /ASSEMBLY_ACC=CAM_ASM_000700 /TAXON_ID=215587 /ORGANISM="Aplanochytrium stocchinoi, Strain GSBS06" /LENGTH=471 /DNA_ID=CAMNT_0052012551 /DNA_START=14 /DNA_END=1429 /DNA_ORIENTATION=-